ncbi:helix-turn-helix transcriptional regulator [Streptomyces boninensis]|uniref:helix-turn-helix transcriptional regulator n=1 Tax=Streptomyces boninensis TaxID=2039455 RepID=UPI003B210531
MRAVPEPHSGWTFLTNHARVLAAIAQNRHARIRDIAAHCRLTERAVQKIIADLEYEGYLSHHKEGRSNTYRIEPDKVLRHPTEAGLPVAELLSLLLSGEDEGEAGQRAVEGRPGQGRPIDRRVSEDA